MTALGLLVLAALAVVALVLALEARQRLDRAERENARRDAELATLREALLRLGPRPDAASAATGPPHASSPAELESVTPHAGFQPPASAPSSIAPPPSAASTAALAGPGAAAARPPRPLPPPPPLPRAPSAPQPRLTPPPDAAPPRPFDWESFFGVRFFSWLAAVALVVGGSFFLHYSIQQGWLAPPVRVAMGLVLGIGLILVCELKVAGRYRTTANAMHGAGIALLLATAWAAHVLWMLVPLLPTFLFMAAVVAVAVALAVRHSSQFIALLGLIGGFVTPALLSTEEDRALGLFSYLLLLTSGLAWTAWRRGWPWLVAVSLALTTFYQWAWVADFLETGKLSLAVLIFLAFPAVNCAFFAFASRQAESDDERRRADTFGHVAAASLVLPAAFALYIGALPQYGERFHLVLGFLWLVAGGLSALGVAQRASRFLVIASASSLVGWLTFLAGSWSRVRAEAWPVAVAWLVAFVLLALAAIELLRRLDPARPRLGLAGVAAAALLVVGAALAIAERETREPLALFGALVALLAVSSAAGLLAGEAWRHAAGVLAVALAAFAWLVASEPADLAPALAVVGALALVTLAIPWTARVLPRELAPPDVAAVSCVLPLLLALVVADTSRGAGAPWGWVALLLAIVAGVAALGVALGRALPLGLVLCASALPLVTWQGTGTWAGVSRMLVAATLLGALGAAAVLAARWRGGAVRELAGAASAGLVACQATLAILAAWNARVDAGVVPVGLASIALALLAVGVAWWSDEPRHGLVAAFAAPLGLLAWATRNLELANAPALWWMSLALHLVFVGWPLAQGSRLGESAVAHAAAALSALATLALGRLAFDEARWEGALGALPLSLALLHAALLVSLARRKDAVTRDRARMGLVFAVTVALVTVAVPWQLDRQWVTLGWGVEAVALMALGIAARERAVRGVAIGLLLVVILKAFLLDLFALGGLYRVASFIGLAICLALVALAFQRFVLHPESRA